MLTKGPLSCILAAVLLVTPALSQNVKGVAPEKQALYKVSGDSWTCLDKSKTIPASAINDDYCDCPDGSDEPGTSACPNGVFYCENKGHIPSYIKSYRVNDGVCDAECCDGSDESSGLIKCDNICKEVGIQYRKQKAELDAIVAAGATTKKEWIAYGQTKEKENQIRKAQLEEEIAVLRKELEVLQKSEETARSQEKEARDTYAALHGSSGSSKCPPCKANCDAAQLKIGSLRNHIRNLQDEVDELLNLLHDMKRDHNQNYHDMAVKSAISGYDEFLVEYDNVKSERQEDVEDTQYEENLDTVTEDVTDGSINEESEEDHDPKVKEAKQGNMISRVASLLVTKLEHILPATVMQALPSYLSMNDAERLQQVVTEASDAVQSKNNDIDNKESELRTVNEQLNKDYGKDKEWMKLDQQCFEKDEGEYVYSICIFGHAHQRSNRDGANTSLGSFEHFSGSSDADSPEYHSKQLYNHGAKCWNGPERSVRAVFECGGTTEILEVTEPEKCEYQFKMRSPAVCSHVVTKEEKESEARIVHQEL